jgi:hypothetical protein
MTRTRRTRHYLVSPQNASLLREIGRLLDAAEAASKQPETQTISYADLMARRTRTIDGKPI